MFDHIREYKIDPTDLYHEDHPLHFLVLDEFEKMDEAMKNYEDLSHDRPCGATAR